MAKILYIAGYGRSGSTVLDIVLNNHPEIVGVGEVGLILDEWTNQRVCACGVPYDKCVFWRDFVATQTESSELGRLVRRIEGISFFPRLLLGWVDSQEKQAYRAYQAKLFDQITTKSGKQIVVDSSKSARWLVGRFLALDRLADQDVYVLHLVRDGRATMASLTRTGSNWAKEGYTQPLRLPGFRAALGWVAANLWTTVSAQVLSPNRYLRLRYEDFMAHPSTSLQIIGGFCGIDMAGLLRKVDQHESFVIGHRVGGNRVRFEEELRLKRAESLCVDSRLKLHHSLIFALVGGWLNRHYGYLGPRKRWRVYT